MSSLIVDTKDACEEETILPEVEELEFHPGNLSTKEPCWQDIQEELKKLETSEISYTDNETGSESAVDVNVVDHEVTIIAEQAKESSTVLPELLRTEHSQSLKEKTSKYENNTSNSLIEEDENHTKLSVLNKKESSDMPKNTVAKHSNNPGNQNISLSAVTTVPSRPTMNMSHLKVIRPLPEGVKANKSIITLNQPKKNVLTKLFLTQNNQASPDSPIIFGEAGGQPIRLVGQSKAIITSSGSTKAITFAQAQEMGLLSPSKMHIIPGQTKGLKKSVIMGPNKTLTMVKSSPTKILPLPTAGHLQPIAPSPTAKTLTPTRKFLIRQPSSSVKTGHFSGAMLNNAVSSSGHILQLPVSQANSQVHQIHLPGKQVQYVRLVNSVTTNAASVPTETITKSEPDLITTPNTTNETPKPVVPIALISSKTVPNPFHVKTVRASSSSADSQLPVPSLAPITDHPSSSSSPPSPPSQSSSSPLTLTTSKTLVPLGTNFVHKTKSSSETQNGIRYCDCFANGEFCFQCNCNCCYNNLDYEEERQKAIKACLERNPNAFRPKIGKGYVGDERRHNKGCNCKRSGCLKNYCECYEAKIPCSNNCKCVGCRNIEELRDTHDGCVVEISKISQQFPVKAKLTYEIEDNSNKPNLCISTQTARQPSNLMTQEVVEATCQCLLAQSECRGKLTEDIEKLILEEFGRCLVEIIDYATRTVVPNTT